MPAVVDPADAELVAIVALRDNVDALSETTVSGEIPSGWQRGDLHVRVVRIGGTRDHPGWLDRARLQVEVFAATAIEAHDVAAACLNVLYRLGLGDLAAPAGAVVTGIREELGLANRPDPDTGSPRYLFAVVLTVHPARA